MDRLDPGTIIRPTSAGPWEERRSTPYIRRRHDTNDLTECNRAQSWPLLRKFHGKQPTLESGSKKLIDTDDSKSRLRHSISRRDDSMWSRDRLMSRGDDSMTTPRLFDVACR